MARIEITLPEKFVFSTEIPVRISDINRGRHLGHDAVLPIAEEARVRFLHSLGYTEENIDGASFMVVDAGIIYKKQGYYGQTLKVEIGLADFSARGFDMVFRITDSASGDEIVRIKTGILFYSYAAQKLMPVPDGFKQRFANA